MRTFSLAARNLLRRRRRSVLSGGALALGVAAVLLLRGMTGGVQHLNTSMMVDGHLGAVQVHRRGYLAAAEAAPLGLDFEDTEALRARLRATPGVRAVAPRIVFGAALSPSADREAAQVMATAVEPAFEREVGWRRASWASAWFSGSAVDAVLLDAELAESLSLAADPTPRPPQELPALLANDRDEALSAEPVRVIGTVRNGLPGERRTVLVPLGLAQRLLRMEGRVTEYALSVESLAEAPDVAARLAAVLGPDFEVHAWSARAPFLKDIEAGQDVFGALLGLVVLSVVVLGIANALFMNVMDRVAEVGTMLALGMRRAAIVRLFLLEGLLLAALGVAAGLVLGGAALELWRRHGVVIHTPGTTLDQLLYPRLTAPWVVGTAAAALVAAGLASLWAAGRAARLSPIEALREP